MTFVLPWRSTLGWTCLITFLVGINKQGYAHSINHWAILGPFVVSKGELDGDPLEYISGGPVAVAASYDWRRHKKGKDQVESALEFPPSEYAPFGKVNWQRVKSAADGSGVVTISYDQILDWNNLIRAVGGLELLEYQALAIGLIELNAEDDLVRISCSGVSKFYVNNDLNPIAADPYFGTKGSGTTLRLKSDRTYNYIRLRLRAKHRGAFSCKVSPFRLQNSIRLSPRVQPDILVGFKLGLFSDLVAITFENVLPAGSWLTDIQINISSPGDIFGMSENDQPTWPDVAGSQTTMLRTRLSLKKSYNKLEQVCKKHGNIDVKFVVSAKISDSSEGLDGEVLDSSVTIGLRCRLVGQSFIFTFFDADMSVQNAAAVHPPADAICRQSNIGCPVLLALHGTGIPASDSADAFKVKLEGDIEYTFGTKHGWLLAPSRHGAHNWEGVGKIHAIGALLALEKLTMKFSEFRANSNIVFFSGHSMGGHGAWILGVSESERAIGLNVNAGWIRKEYYGDSNVMFLHDAGVHAVDPALKYIIEASVCENNVDMHVSNLANIPILARIGKNDGTVHPWFMRRMMRILKTTGNHENMEYFELENKQHWWWDTSYPNDGGAVNDDQIRDFIASCFDQKGEHSHDDRPVKITVLNPASVGPINGFRILQQLVSYRLSTLSAERNGTTKDWLIKTSNVARFSVGGSGKGIQYQLEDNLCESDYNLDECPHSGTKDFAVYLDGQKFLISELFGKAGDKKTFCREPRTFENHRRSSWQVCEPEDQIFGERVPETYGPMRQVFEKKFSIVYGDGYLKMAIYLANLLYTTGHVYTNIRAASDMSLENDLFGQNIVLIGGPAKNHFTKKVLEENRIADFNITFNNGIETLHVGPCLFTGNDIGFAGLFPLDSAKRSLGLVLLGLSNTSAGSEHERVQGNLGLLNTLGLGSPAIPPMVRQPFSNALPDYVVLGPGTPHLGIGGFLMAGFWNSNWEYAPESSYITQCNAA